MIITSRSSEHNSLPGSDTFQTLSLPQPEMPDVRGHACFSEMHLSIIKKSPNETITKYPFHTPLERQYTDTLQINTIHRRP